MVSPNHFTDLAEVEQRLARFETRYNRTARPLRRTFTRDDLQHLPERISHHESSTPLPTMPRASPG